MKISMGSDSKDTKDHPVPTTPEPVPNHDITTNGAPSDVVTEVGTEWVLSLAEHGFIPIRQLDAVVHAADSDVRMLLESIDIAEGHIVETLLNHLKARREGDKVGYLKSMSILAKDPASPFCVSQRAPALRLSLIHI